jgi:hypothetical protein
MVALVHIRLSAFCSLLYLHLVGLSIFPNTVSILLYHIERITVPAPYVSMTQSKTNAEGQVDWNNFVHQPGAQVNSNFADSTKQTSTHIRRNFERFNSLYEIFIHYRSIYSIATNLDC